MNVSAEKAANRTGHKICQANNQNRPNWLDGLWFPLRSTRKKNQPERHSQQHGEYASEIDADVIHGALDA